MFLVGTLPLKNAVLGLNLTKDSKTCKNKITSVHSFCRTCKTQRVVQHDSMQSNHSGCKKTSSEMVRGSNRRGVVRHLINDDHVKTVEEP